jgi:hypothetical protein
MSETILDPEGNLIAILLLANHGLSDFGIKFLTEDKDSLQLGVMKHRKEHKIAAHIHNKKPRTVETTKEVLFIRSGLVRMDLFGINSEYFVSHNLTAGDVVLLVGGGHGFEILEESEIIELKQGPYMGIEDKYLISDVAIEDIKF